MRYKSHAGLLWALVAAASALGFTACTTSVQAPRAPAGDIQGYVMLGPVRDATVRVYDFTNGKKEALLATTQTNMDGFYSVRARRGASPTILVEVASGHYVEDIAEFSATVTLRSRQVLQAVGFFAESGITTLHVTPFTHLASGLAAYAIDRGTPAATAVRNADDAVTRMVDGIDILKTSPLRTLRADPGMNIPMIRMAAMPMSMDVPPDYLYGLFCGAFSAFAKAVADANNAPPFADYTSIGLAQLMYEDIAADGVLDGKGASAINLAPRKLSYGGFRLDSTSYRQYLGLGVLQLATQHKADNVAPFESLVHQAHYFAESRNILWGPGVPTPFDNEPPEIRGFTRVGYDKTNGVAVFRADASDPAGIRSLRVTVDNVVVSDDVTLTGNLIELRVNDVGQGVHAATLEAKDILGNTASRAFSFIMPDGKPIALMDSADITNQAQYTAQGEFFDDNGVGIASIMVTAGTAAGVRAALNPTLRRWSAALALKAGENPISIRITDNQGNARDSNATVTLDTSAPVLSVAYSAAEFDHGGQIISDTLGNANAGSDPLYIPASRIGYFNPVAAADELDTARIPYFTLQVSENFAPEKVTVGLQYRLNNTIRANLRLLRVGTTTTNGKIYLLPLIGEILSDRWYQANPTDVHYLDLEVRDAAGNVTNRSLSFKANFDLPTIQVASPVGGAMVHAHEYANGSPAGEIGACMTDARGRCTLRVLADPMLIHFELMGGNYRESGNGTGVDIALGMEEQLSSILNFQGGNSQVAITPFSHLGAGLMTYAFNQGSDVANAFNQSLTRLDSMFGFDVFVTAPDDPAALNLDIIPMPAETRYTLWLGGLSRWMAKLNMRAGYAPFTMYTSVSAAQKFYRDAVTDGILDGQEALADGTRAALAIGDSVLDANTYRALAGHILEFVITRFPLSSAARESVLATALGIAENTSPLFGGLAPAAFDARRPIVELKSATSTRTAAYAAKVSVYSAVATVARVTINGVNTTRDSVGDWGTTLTWTLQGRNALQVRAYDAAGVELANQTLDVLFDNTAPVLTIVSPTANQTVGNATWMVTGTALDAAGLARVTVKLGAQIVDATARDWTARVTLNAGLNTITVEAVDALGNIATQTVTVNYYVAGPKVEFVNAPTPRTVDTRPVFQGTVDGLGLTFTLNATLYKQQAASWTVVAQKAITANASGVWSLDWFGGGLAPLLDANYKMSITAVNSMNNSSLTETPFTVDTLGPNLRIISPLTATRDNPYTLTIEAVDGSGSVTSLTVDGIGAVAQGTNRWTYAVPVASADGTRMFAIAARDDLGNGAQLSYAVTLDTLAPALTVGSAFISRTATFALTGVATDANPAAISVRNGAGTFFSSNFVSGQTWSVNLTGLVAGNNAFTVTALDQAGNTSAAQTVTVNYDPTAPTFTIANAGSVTAGTNSFTVFSNQTALAVNAVDNTGGTGVKNIVFSGGGSSTARTVTAPIGTIYTDTRTQSTEATYSYTVIANDNAGNAGATTTVSFTYDKTLPTNKITTTNFSASSSSFTLNGTATEKNPDQIIVTNTTTGGVFKAAYTSGSTWSVKLTVVSGNNACTVVATDKAGNVSTTLNVTIKR